MSVPSIERALISRAVMAFFLMSPPRIELFLISRLSMEPVATP